jgi:hypothetical protein
LEPVVAVPAEILLFLGLLPLAAELVVLEVTAPAEILTVQVHPVSQVKVTQVVVETGMAVPLILQPLVELVATWLVVAPAAVVLAALWLLLAVLVHCGHILAVTMQVVVVVLRLVLPIITEPVV